MKFGYSEDCLEHDTGDRHPESPDRLRAIRKMLARKHQVEYVESAPAPVEALVGVHDREYVEKIRDFCLEGGGQWDPDTVAVEATWAAASRSAGLAMWAARESVRVTVNELVPFSLGRPPGHHAVVDDAMGFCFFNNTAVAANHVIESGLADRVAIFDWDVHHGNGTQDMFYDRGDVYYASIHEDGLYPGTGAITETGTGPGAETTLNIPLPAGAGDSAYQIAMDEFVQPAVSQYGPDLLIVSAGFDAHQHDPISRMRLSTEGYGRLTASVRSLAATTDAPLAFVLEGGYSLEMLAEGVGIVQDVCHGYEPSGVDGSISREVEDRFAEIRKRHGRGSK